MHHIAKIKQFQRTIHKVKRRGLITSQTKKPGSLSCRVLSDQTKA